MGYRPIPAPVPREPRKPDRFTAGLTPLQAVRYKATIGAAMVGAALTLAGVAESIVAVAFIGAVVLIASYGHYGWIKTKGEEKPPEVEAGEGKIDTKDTCHCGSEADSAPVETTDEHGQPITVAMLCPDCLGKRTEKQLRVEAERKRALARAVEVRQAAQRAVDAATPEDVDRFEHEKFRLALADVIARMDALSDGWDIVGEDFRVSAEDHDRYLALKDQAEQIGAELRRIRSGRTRTGQVAPMPGTIIEDGEWTYEIPWHAEDDLCNSDDHEWESIYSYQSSVPIRTTCTRCGARRWRTMERITDPDTGEHLGDIHRRDCPGCSGRGERFGYRCDPCGGTGMEAITSNPTPGCGCGLHPGGDHPYPS